jgi:hypothetical protein
MILLYKATRELSSEKCSPGWSIDRDRGRDTDREREKGGGGGAEGGGGRDARLA